MTHTEPQWEPPRAGTEAEHLVGALERLRATFRWKVDGLDQTGLNTRIGASSLTLGGLLKHLAAVEDFTFRTKLSGQSMKPYWNADEGATLGNGCSPLQPTTRPRSCTPCGTGPSNGPGRGSPQP